MGRALCHQLPDGRPKVCIGSPGLEISLLIPTCDNIFKVGNKCEKLCGGPESQVQALKLAPGHHLPPSAQGPENGAPRDDGRLHALEASDGQPDSTQPGAPTVWASAGVAENQDGPLGRARPEESSLEHGAASELPGVL
eukprot:1189132-Pyramimonas_sp.AAC.1